MKHQSSNLHGHILRISLASFALIATLHAAAQSRSPVDEPQSSSLMAEAVAPITSAQNNAVVGGTAQPVSMFAVVAPEPRRFAVHDLVQIIVRETSTTRRSHELETKKDFELDGEISAFPDLNLNKLLDFQFAASKTAGLPEVGIEFAKDYKGEGEYTRRDDMTDRITAEVIEILPNGNLVLESRTTIKTDAEESEMTLTGICRPEDVTAANTLISSQLHGLNIRRVHSGELKKSAKKGILSKVLETVFAF